MEIHKNSPRKMIKQRPKTEKELKKEGFKLIENYNYLYINVNGKVYSTKTRKYIQPTARNYIKAGQKYINVPKVVLMAFKNEPIRNGKILYIDGNTANLSHVNIKYSRLFTNEQTKKVNNTDLMTSIRCYFEVEQKFKIRDNFKTRLFLKSILEKRAFFLRHKKIQGIEVYLTYLGKHLFEQKSIAYTAKEHSLPVRDCLVIVNSFTNILITEILQDLENGILYIHGYLPKLPTKTDEIKQINEYLTSKGQTALPLRKKSEKQIVKDFQNYLQDLQNT